MGVSKRVYNTVFTWTRTVGDLIAEPATVTALCSHCPSRVIDLEPIRLRHGPLFSFWNRHAPCTRPGCAGVVHFSAQRVGAMHWPAHMRDGPPHEVEALHRFWRAWEEAPHSIRPSINWPRAHKIGA